MDKFRRRELVESVAAEFDLSHGAGYRDLARQVGAVWSTRSGHRVAVRFARLPHSHITGATALLRDGSYLVICAESPSWFFRLHVLLHEFAHALLGHEYITLDRREGIRILFPNLLPRMAEIVAGRTQFTEREEADAETVADELLAALTENRSGPDPAQAGKLAIGDDLDRLRETLEH